MTVSGQNIRIQVFDADGAFIAQWLQLGRPSALYIDRRTDTIYVADSESRDARTNTGRNALSATTGYGFNLGVQRGVRIGSARDGAVTAFIPDPWPYPLPPSSHRWGKASPLMSTATSIQRSSGAGEGARLRHE